MFISECFVIIFWFFVVFWVFLAFLADCQQAIFYGQPEMWSDRAGLHVRVTYKKTQHAFSLEIFWENSKVKNVAIKDKTMSKIPESFECPDCEQVFKSEQYYSIHCQSRCPVSESFLLDRWCVICRAPIPKGGKVTFIDRFISIGKSAHSVQDECETHFNIEHSLIVYKSIGYKSIKNRRNQKNWKNCKVNCLKKLVKFDQQNFTWRGWRSRWVTSSKLRCQKNVKKVKEKDQFPHFFFSSSALGSPLLLCSIWDFVCDVK